jgi:hypothetical protein
MDLAALADHVTSKTGKLDPESLECAKNYLRARHELCYDAHLWKDTVLPFEAPVTAAQKYVVLPYECARPLAAWDTRMRVPIEIASLATIVAINPMALTEESWTYKFTEVDSVGWPFLMTEQLFFQVNNSLPEAVTLNFSGRAMWPDTRAGSHSVDHTHTASVASNTQASTPYFQQLYRITKPVTSGPIFIQSLAYSPIPNPNQRRGEWLWPADSTTAVFARIQLMSPASGDFTLGVLGKRRFRQMRLDSDAPMIRGLDNALIAFAIGDMLERSRQYAKAAAKQQEGTELLKVAVDTETNQSAYESRVIPVQQGYEGTEADLNY